MRDIEGIDEAISELSNYWPQINDHFNSENEKYKSLLNQDTGNIGRILKCHLIIEKYINNYIIVHNNIRNIEDLNLSFYQKACMLPQEGSSAAIVKPGIIQINKIRNKYSHNLNASITNNDLSAVDSILSIARPGLTDTNHVVRIEAFTTIACTWLMITPPELTVIFQKAFRKITVN